MSARSARSRGRRRLRPAEGPAAPVPEAAPPSAPPDGSGLLARGFAPVDVASLVVFRVAMGATMIWEVYRYFSRGWIESYYIDPSFHFSYYGFGWVKPWPGQGMYIHFAVLGLAALGILLGAWYRLSAVVFFLGFTYVFLLDQARYLNHFYLIVLLSALLVFLPLNRHLALDARRRKATPSETVPAWCLWLVRLQVGVPYFYGGLAKLNGDWLAGEPMRSWLARRDDYPVVGPWFTEEPVVWAFVYGGLLLDLLIVPALAWRRTRPWAFASALAFHGLNAWLFTIGIFPWLMMAATTVWFEPDWPRKRGLFAPRGPAAREAAAAPLRPLAARATLAAVGAWLLVQALLPLRHFAYPGNVSWTEEGHRFAWHMKLRDKDGDLSFVLTDPARGESWYVHPGDTLTRRQESWLATHPDMILQFAHHLRDEYRRKGHPGVQVKAVGSASLNGRDPQPLIDPDVDLAVERRTLWPASWIVPLRKPLPPRGGGAVDDDMGSAE